MEALTANLQSKVLRAHERIKLKLSDIGTDAHTQAIKHLDAKLYKQNSANPRSGYRYTQDLKKSTRVDISQLDNFRVGVNTGEGFAPYAEYIERGPGGGFGSPKRFKHAGDLSYMWPTYLEFRDGTNGRQSVRDQIREAVETA